MDLGRGFRREKRDQKAAVAAVDGEVGVGRPDGGTREYFGLPDEAGVGERHGNIGIAVEERAEGAGFRSGSEPGEEHAPFEHLQEKPHGDFPALQEEAGLGQDGVAGEERRHEGVHDVPGPGVVLVAPVEVGHERAGVGQDQRGDRPNPAR